MTTKNKSFFSRKPGQQFLKLIKSVKKKKMKQAPFLFYIRPHVNRSSLGVFTIDFRLVKMHGGNVYISFI